MVPHRYKRLPIGTRPRERELALVSARTPAVRWELVSLRLDSFCSSTSAATPASLLSKAATAVDSGDTALATALATASLIIDARSGEDTLGGDGLTVGGDWEMTSIGWRGSVSVAPGSPCCLRALPAQDLSHEGSSFGLSLGTNLMVCAFFAGLFCEATWM